MVGKGHYVDVRFSVGLDYIEVDGRGHGPAAWTKSAHNKSLFYLWNVGVNWEFES